VKSHFSFIFPPFFSVLILSSIIFLMFIPCHASEKINFCSLSIMIDQPSHFDELNSFLSDLNFKNWTFAINPSAESYILDNSTRVSILQTYGDIIPTLPLMHKYTTSERKTIIDDKISLWQTKLGKKPCGFMAFMPDTYTANYLYSLNISYLQGYCFDQYVIDYMTMRGGWQTPYFSHPWHVLRPNNLHPKGLVIFPHGIWDWIASFEVNHVLHTHPSNLVYFFNHDIPKAKQYFLNLISETIRNLYPFGYASVQFEWVWSVINPNIKDVVKDWIQDLISLPNINFWTFEDIAIWFRNNYDFTPNYRIKFVSPYTKKEIEWHYCLDFRVARVNGKVVSYVDYSSQEKDVYLNTHANIDYNQPESSTNCADNSLNFEIDALGGASNRHPITTNAYSYTGNLEDFPLYYDVRHNLIEKELPFILLTLGAISALGYIILRRVS